jgi:hypothetical protein
MAIIKNPKKGNPQKTKPKPRSKAITAAATTIAGQHRDEWSSFALLGERLEDLQE